MQLPIFSNLLGITDFDSAAILAQHSDQLISVSAQTGRVIWYDAAAHNPSASVVVEASFAPSEVSVLNGALWLWEGLQGRGVLIDGETLVPRWANGVVMTVSAVFELSDGQLLINPNGADNLVLADQIGAAKFRVIDQITDGPKQSVGGLTAAIEVQVSGISYTITGSIDGGLTSLTTSDDALFVVDHLGPKDGLFVNGISALETVEIDGKDFIIALSPIGTLVSLRVNANGVFFVEDQIWDNLGSRFSGAQAMDLISTSGRHFVVTGGADQGLSVIEVLPDGKFLHHGALAQSLDWYIGAITDIEAIVTGSGAQIFASGTGSGVAQFDWKLNPIGDRKSGGAGHDQLFGSWKDDLLIGGSGDDTLSGGSGADVLIDGSGNDTLSGGAGADIFVFVADGARDAITGFELGQDRIMLQDWGRIYDLSALTFQRSEVGAKIIWGDEVIDIHTANGQAIEVDDWSADDFIF